MTTSAWDHSSRPIWTVLDRRDEFDRPDLPLLTVVSEHGVRVRDLSDGRTPSEDLSGYRVVHPGDLVVNKMWARFGAYGVAEQSGIISPAYWILTPRAGVVEPRFLHHLLRSAAYRAEIWRRSKDLPPNGFDLPWDQFRTIVVPVPPLKTQRSIADFLDAATTRLDALIAAKRRMVELLEDRFMRFVQTLVRANEPLAKGRLVPLKYLARIERGVFSHRPRNDPAFYDGPHPFIQTGDVARARKYVESWTQTLNDRGLAVSRRFPAGTLTMVIAANIGDVGVTTFDACFPDSVVGIMPNSSVLDSNYLYFGLLAAKRSLIEMAPVTTQANLNVERIGTLVVRHPTIEDQQAIAKRLDSEMHQVDQVVSREQQSITLLQERRLALITAAVTGQLDIPAK